MGTASEYLKFLCSVLSPYHTCTTGTALTSNSSNNKMQLLSTLFTLATASLIAAAP